MKVLKDTQYDHKTISIESTSIQKSPNNYQTLMATFIPGEQLRESDNMNCKARTCRIFNLGRQETDHLRYWFNILCVSLKYIPEALQQPTGPSQSSSIRETNI
jgi:hypothetical protein